MANLSGKTVELVEEIDEIVSLVDDNGDEFEVEVIYGEEDMYEVFARIIRNHYLD